MGLFLNVLLGLMIFLSVLIVGIILLQEDKSGGGIGVVGGSSQSFFGASSASLLARISAVMVTLFFIFAIVIGILVSRDTSEAQIDGDALVDLEFENIQTESVNVISSLPDVIAKDMFNNEILNLIESESDKEKVLSIYTLDEAGELYQLDSKAESDIKDEVLKIIRETNFSFQTSEVKIEK